MQPICSWRILLTWRTRAAAVVLTRPYGQRPCGFLLCGAAVRMNAPPAGVTAMTRDLVSWKDQSWRDRARRLSRSHLATQAAVLLPVIAITGLSAWTLVSGPIRAMGQSSPDRFAFASSRHRMLPCPTPKPIPRHPTEAGDPDGNRPTDGSGIGRACDRSRGDAAYRGAAGQRAENLVAILAPGRARLEGARHLHAAQQQRLRGQGRRNRLRLCPQGRQLT